MRRTHLLVQLNFSRLKEFSTYWEALRSDFLFVSFFFYIVYVFFFLYIRKNICSYDFSLLSTRNPFFYISISPYSEEYFHVLKKVSHVQKFVVCVRKNVLTTIQNTSSFRLDQRYALLVETNLSFSIFTFLRFQKNFSLLQKTDVSVWKFITLQKKCFLTQKMLLFNPTGTKNNIVWSSERFYLEWVFFLHYQSWMKWPYQLDDWFPNSVVQVGKADWPGFHTTLKTLLGKI